MEGNLSWEAFDRGPKQNDPSWFIALIIITISLAAASVIFGNIIFAVLVVISGITMGLHARSGPPHFRVNIGDDSILVNETFIPYSSIISFSFDDNLLLIERDSWWRHLLIVPLGNIGEDRVREVLREKLTEGSHKEPFSHKIMEKVGF